MIKYSEYKPIFNWVVINKLAIGKPPDTITYIETLKKYNIKNILTLCSEKEFKPNKSLLDDFSWKRCLLPDHRDNRDIKIEEIKKALKILKKFMDSGPTYVHCFASVERSPLICISWLMNNKKLNANQALSYMMEIHPRTNPLTEHLLILKNIDNF